jgi:hypothetical protein
MNKLEPGEQMTCQRSQSLVITSLTFDLQELRCPGLTGALLLTFYPWRLSCSALCFVLFLAVLRMEPRASSVPGKCYTTELQPQPSSLTSDPWEPSPSNSVQGPELPQTSDSALARGVCISQIEVVAELGPRIQGIWHEGSARTPAPP